MNETAKRKFVVWVWRREEGSLLKGEKCSQIWQVGGLCLVGF